MARPFMYGGLPSSHGVAAAFLCIFLSTSSIFAQKAGCLALKKGVLGHTWTKGVVIDIYEQLI